MFSERFWFITELLIGECPSPVWFNKIWWVHNGCFLFGIDCLALRVLHHDLMGFDSGLPSRGNAKKGLTPTKLCHVSFGKEFKIALQRVLFYLQIDLLDLTDENVLRNWIEKPLASVPVLEPHNPHVSYPYFSDYFNQRSKLKSWGSKLSSQIVRNTFISFIFNTGVARVVTTCCFFQVLLYML